MRLWTAVCILRKSETNVSSRKPSGRFPACLPLPFFPLRPPCRSENRRQAPAVPFNRAIKTRMGLWFMPLLLLTILPRGETVSSILRLRISFRHRIHPRRSRITGISSPSARDSVGRKGLRPSFHKLVLYEPQNSQVRAISRLRRAGRSCS